MSSDDQEPKVGTIISVVTAEDFENRSKSLIELQAEDQAEFDALAQFGKVDDLPTEPEVTPKDRPAAGPAKADIRMRALGRAIDVVIFGLLAELVFYIGPLVALVYLLLADGLIDGASIGKRLTKIKVVRNSDGKPAKVFDSLLRNAPLGIAGLFVLIPLVGWALFLTLGLAIILFESYMVWRDPKGVRAGDILAGTHVEEVSKKD